MIKLTLSWRRNTGHKANVSIAKVIVAKACHVDGNRDAKQTDANIAAFNEKG